MKFFHCLDPVIVSNTIGTISYATAGPNTRTTQLFINYINNSRLDPLGFSPFGRLILVVWLKSSENISRFRNSD